MQKNQTIWRLFALILTLGTVVLGASCRKETTQDSAHLGNDQALATQKIKEALEFYKQREDFRKVRQGVTLLREARTGDYGNYEAAWRLAQFNYYLGDHTDNGAERDAAFREGIEAGKAAVKLQDNKPEGHFWLGANYGGAAQSDTLAGLSSFSDIKSEMEKVMSLDEGYQSGSAYLGLGQLYLEAPRLMGGDHQKAVEYLEKGLRFGANNPLLRLRLAEAYEAADRVPDARKQIEYISQMTTDPEYQPEYKDAVEKAKKLQEKIDRK